MSSRVEQIGDKSVAFVDDEEAVLIYAFRLASGATLYVGSTSQKLRLRVRAHIRDAQCGSDLPVHAWLRECSTFQVVVLERTTVAEREARERFWIAQYAGLLNLTNGGPGMSGHKFAGTEHARRIAQRIRTAPKCSCAQCGVDFHRKASQARKFTRHFCSRACYAASLRRAAA